MPNTLDQISHILSKFLLSIKIKIKIIEQAKCFFLFICGLATVCDEAGGSLHASIFD